MTTSSPPHDSCAAFNELDTPLGDGIHRFVVGADARPRVLTRDEAAAELGDRFAVLLLLEGVFPKNAGEVLEALDRAVPAGDPLRHTQFFVVGDGSQIPVTPETAGLNRSLRFLASRGTGGEGPDIMLSAFHPDETDVEVMAWDHAHTGFNYYRTVGESRAWVYAGNSRHALVDPTQGKGPFESHLSGAFLMKELRAPWINWHSPDANIQPSAFAEDDPLADHQWFRQKEPLGAFICETAVARPSITRWATARFDALAAAGMVADPERVLRQVLTSPAVNLVTSHTESANATNVDSIDLPQTFFVDSEALVELLGLPAPPPLAVAADVYLRALGTFEVVLSDGRGFIRPGDTHFAFCVPERAFEDHETMREAIRIGLLTERLAATLLMTDFPNPVFSPRREALLAHVPESAVLTDGSSEFPEQFVAAIVAAAENSGQGSPEREFAELWAAGANWKQQFGELLSAYYDAVVSRLLTDDGFEPYMRLAESRRERVRRMPIAESPLLFASTTITSAERAMRADGTVQEG
jgi:hypothetical protein